MRWLKRKLYNWLMTDEAETACYPTSPKLNRTSSIDIDEGLNMNIFRASSGYVLKFSRYDHMKDRQYQKLYIVNDEDDFDERIGSMIKMEMLKLPQQ